MRKFQKRNLIEVFSYMMQMHKEIEQLFLKGDYKEVQNFLVKCQEAAIQAGNTIEHEGAKGLEAIKKLEEYCEAVYEHSVKIGKYQKKISYREAKHLIVPMCRQMDWYVSEAKESVRKQIPEKQEVVFFPYKASMWDSLESVWMAADKDADCDAYVVPIPYFDKNKDGTVSTMHYEGDQLPEYVPIVKWEDYNVTERHPDVIYIHNPYDNTNKVTTVHMDYYAKELKKHTDMLVYIPYFVCMDDSISDHLCVQPGTMYADRVIVQSEKVRDIYISVFHKFEEENNCKGIFGDIEKKFVALGSPKYDKVLRTTRENVQIPDDWLAKIEKENGERRKVILYNTSVINILEGKENEILKIQSVLENIKRNGNVVLLWRPHPLSKETCETLRPELVEKYYEIVETYQRENWGIYDDTPDLHRAIAISDAYYGDASSLVDLYRLTGKPIMIQNINIV